jgi:hypothetical protein
MSYRVIWRLVGREGRHLDGASLEGVYLAYGEAVAAINELLKPYCEVSRDHEQGVWLARRSADADLAICVWVEQTDDIMHDGAHQEGLTL